MWAAGLGVGFLGFWWIKKRGTTSSTSPATTGAQPNFSQTQEVQDFQIFSSLTGAQQASDLNFLTEVAGLFGGGGSTATTPTPTTPTPVTPPGGTPTPAPVPAPAPKPVAPPAVAPVAPAATVPSTYGYGIVPTAQGPMVWLGTTGAGGSTASDYQVGGGAPVYFGNASQLAIGGTNMANEDVYTPVAFENLVSKGPA
jgi:hypothetical protein